MTYKSLRNTAIAWAAVVISIILLILSSCKVLKTRDEAHQASSQVKQSDSTSLKKSETSSEKELEWWRNTAIFPGAQSGDTTIINNNYYPGQPAVIIQEGGKSKEVARQIDYDSLAKAIKDSSVAAASQENTTKEVKPTLLLQLLPWGIGIVIFLQLYSIASKFKIIKRG